MGDLISQVPPKYVEFSAECIISPVRHAKFARLPWLPHYNMPAFRGILYNIACEVVEFRRTWPQR